MLYLAIDQHRNQLTVNVRNEAGDVIQRRQVSTRWDKVLSFFEKMRSTAQQEGGFMTIVEVCGFNDWLLKVLAEYGCRETVVIQVEKRDKQKTDRRDANQLGELLWTNRQRILEGKKVQNVRRVHLPNAEEAANRQLTTRHTELTELRTRTLNQIHHLLHKHNLHQNCPTKGIQTKAARRWLKELPLSLIDRLEINQLLAQWELCDQQLEVLKAEIERRCDTHSIAPLIRTAPGFSAYSALAVACRLSDDISRFPRGGSLANYFGLAPGCRNSGAQTQRLGGITKAGSPLVRRLLGQVVLHALRRDAWLRERYREIKKRRGSKVARVAVMRRLAVAIWSMVKHRMPYCTGGPERVRQQQAAVAAVGMAVAAK